MNSLSVVINAYNEEKNLPKVIASVKNLADEIVVINQESADKTEEVAKKLGARVFSHKKVSYVEPARNFGISKATSDWVLILDADEEVGTALKKKIKTILKNPIADYFRLPRKNIIFNKWIEHTLWWPDYQIRLFKKGKVSWSEIIHSVPTTLGKGADIPAQEELAIIHHNYDFVESYLEKLNRYTSVQAKFLFKEGYDFKWRDLFSKPLREFVNRYFMGEGYKDGLHGLTLSLLQAFSELVVYVKVWQENKFKEEDVKLLDVVSEMRSKEKEMHYWQADASYNETGKLTDRIRRKFKI
jgi:(heptosyl)LPS beta-1,4-glucosyltransferase